MTHHRFTLEDLEKMSDREILIMIVNERIGDCTNMYSPLPTRLRRISGRLDRKESLERKGDPY